MSTKTRPLTKAERDAYRALARAAARLRKAQEAATKENKERSTVDAR